MAAHARLLLYVESTADVKAVPASRTTLGSPMRHFWTVAVLAATSSAMAETPNDKILRACLTEALTNYSKARVDFDANRGATPPLTIEYLIAKRRLVETYCVQFAGCLVTGSNIPEKFGDVVAGVQFAKCLEEEAEHATLAK